MKRIITIVLLLAVTACKKGEQGNPGPAGIDGNANVHKTDISIGTGSWSSDSYEAYVTTSVPEITQGIYNDGAVQCFIQFHGTEYHAMPYTIPSNGGNTSLTFSYFYSVSSITITAMKNDFSIPTIDSTVNIKIITLEP